MKCVNNKQKVNDLNREISKAKKDVRRYKNEKSYKSSRRIRA